MAQTLWSSGSYRTLTLDSDGDFYFSGDEESGYVYCDLPELAELYAAIGRVLKGDVED